MATVLRASAAAAAHALPRARGAVPRRLASVHGGRASVVGGLSAGAAAAAAAALVACSQSGAAGVEVEEGLGGRCAARAQAHVSEVKPAAPLLVFQTRVRQVVRGGDVRNASDWVLQDLALDQGGNLCCTGKMADAVCYIREDLAKASVEALPEDAACMPFCFCVQVPGSQPMFFAASSSAVRNLWIQELASVVQTASA